MKKRMALLTAALLLLTAAAGVITHAEENEAPALYYDESDLRTLVYSYSMDDSGLTFLKIQMHDRSESEYIWDELPPHSFLDTYHDGDAILLHHYLGLPDGPMDWEEASICNSWFMTFAYDGADWRLTNLTNGMTWAAYIVDGVYTFEDYYFSDPAWQWSVVFEDRLEKLDFTKLEFLVELYELQKPDRPSLSDD